MGKPADIITLMVPEYWLAAFIRLMRPSTGTWMPRRLHIRRKESFFLASCTPMTAAAIRIAISHHQCTQKSELSTTNCVIAGSSEPMLSNVDENTGTAKIMMMATTTTAMTMTNVG